MAGRDEKNFQLLLSSSNVKSFSPASLRVLQSYERDEEKILRSTANHYASRLGRGGTGGIIDVDCIRLACLDRRLIQAPLRPASLETARITNSRTVAWTLGPHVRVPFDCALAERIESTLSTGSSSSYSSLEDKTSPSSSSSSAVRVLGTESAVSEYVSTGEKIKVIMKRGVGEEEQVEGVQSLTKRLKQQGPLEIFLES